MRTSTRRWIASSVVIGVAILAAGGGYFTATVVGDPAADPAPNATPTVAAAVSGIVVDDEGHAIVASIEVENIADSTKTRFQTDVLGRYDFTLDAGEYTLRATKGYEYTPAALSVVIDDRLRREQKPITLERAIDLPSAGWYGGDLHQHSSYDEAQQNVSDILVSNLANGLNWGALTDHNTIAGLPEWVRAGEMLAGNAEPFVAIPGLEVTTDRGHVIVLGPGHLIDPGTDAGADDMQRIIDEAQADGSTIQLNHPHLDEPMGFADWELHPQFDLLEVWNGKAPPLGGSNELSKNSWYELLNDGLFIPATADSDNHDIEGGFAWSRGASDPDDEWMSRGLFSGDPRTYVYAPDGSQQTILAALRAGHSFLTNGPLLQFTLDNAIPGETIVATAGTARLSLTAFDLRGLERAVLIENGVAIKEFDLSSTREEITPIDIPVTSGSWYLVEGFGADGGYAFTNPIFVQ